MGTTIANAIANITTAAGDLVELQCVGGTKSKVTLKLDREFFSYLPRPSAEEHERLETVLLEEGIADRIRVWNENGHLVVIDGMERVQIARAHHLPIQVPLEFQFADREAVKLWMSRNQIARRNLTKEQMAYHLGQVYNANKGQHGGDRTSNANGSAAEKVAEEAGVSPKSVRRAGAYAAQVDAAAARAPEVREALNAGQRIAPAKLKEIAEAESDDEAKEIAARAIVGEPEPEPEAEPEPVLDAEGKPVKDHRYHVVFADLEEFKRLKKEADKLESAMKALAKGYAGAYMVVDNIVLGCFKQIRATLLGSAPYCLCRKCRGHREVEKQGKVVECDGCGGLGWISNMMAERLK